MSPTKSPEGETLENTVKLIMVKCVSARGSVYPDQLRTEILSALRNERERCAKVAEDAYQRLDALNAEGAKPMKAVLTAIREGR